MTKQKVYSKILIALSITLLGCSFAVAGEKQSAQTKQAIAEWKDLKYGMFIHYGMSTYTGREFDLGDQPSQTYAPTTLDVDQWIRVARDAGMKYAVLTSKHVAGHCLWDSKVTWHGKEFDYDVATSSDKTDVIAEFMAACKKYGLKPGLYWCMLDFKSNSVPPKKQWNVAKLPDDFFQLTKDQLTELLTRYPALNYLWLDIPRAASLQQRTEIYNMIKKQRPSCVVLFNHGTPKPTGPMTIDKFQAAWPTDILNTEVYPPKPGWFESPQTWHGQSYDLGYEHCDKIGKDWFWTENEKPRPIEELYGLYKNIIETGGNLLLDVPPDRTGRIPEYHVKTLMDLKKVIDAPSTHANRAAEPKP